MSSPPHFPISFTPPHTPFSSHPLLTSLIGEKRKRTPPADSVDSGDERGDDGSNELNDDGFVSEPSQVSSASSDEIQPVSLPERSYSPPAWLLEDLKLASRLPSSPSPSSSMENVPVRMNLDAARPTNRMQDHVPRGSRSPVQVPTNRPFPPQSQATAEEECLYQKESWVSGTHEDYPWEKTVPVVHEPPPSPLSTPRSILPPHNPSYLGSHAGDEESRQDVEDSMDEDFQ